MPCTQHIYPYSVCLFICSSGCKRRQHSGEYWLQLIQGRTMQHMLCMRKPGNSKCNHAKQPAQHHRSWCYTAMHCILILLLIQVPWGGPHHILTHSKHQLGGLADPTILLNPPFSSSSTSGRLTLLNQAPPWQVAWRAAARRLHCLLVSRLNSAGDRSRAAAVVPTSGW
jgi:hypothetical protein